MARETLITRRRILVVDDDPAIRGSLQDYLEWSGYEVETAENGREALSKLGKADYDAVVTDYSMPEINGLSVLHHLRQHHPSLPAVMIIGEKSSEVAAQALAAGARACLFKPFHPLELEQVLSCE